MKTQSSLSEAGSALPSGSPLIQVSGGLAAIVLLIVLAAWLARRFGLAPKRGGDRELHISSSLSVGTRERVVIVNVPDARLVLGVTATSITTLHMLPPETADHTAPAANSAAFQPLLRKRLLRYRRS